MATSLAVVATVLTLSGCAVGQKFEYANVPIPLGKVEPGAAAGSVGVGVRDARTYVVSGEKPETFVGLMRGGFGNPFEVTTASGKPMAADMRDAIVTALKKKGLTAMPVSIASRDGAAAAKTALTATKANRLVLVTVNEWKSDTMMKTGLIYDVTLAVLDGQGEPLATRRLHGRDDLGNLGLTPHAGVSAGFGRKFDELFNDDKVVAALK